MSEKTMVVKMTVNSKDFDNGLQNAKASMKNFSNQTSLAGSSFKKVIGGMSKAFAALGIAVGATEMFKTFINSTQTIGDKWNNAMTSAKVSFQSFASAVMSGNADMIRSYRGLISAANDYAEAKDATGSAQISNRYARLNYLNPFNQAIVNAQEPGISKEQKQTYLDEAKSYYNAYSENVTNVANKARAEVVAWLNTQVQGYKFDETNIDPVLDNLYLNLINGVTDNVTKRYREVTSREFWKGNALANTPQQRRSMGEAVMLREGYTRDQMYVSRIISQLMEIPDELLNENLNTIQTEADARAELISMQRKMNRALGKSGNGGGGGGFGGSEKVTLEIEPKMDVNQLAQYIWNNKTIDTIPYTDLGIPEENIVEPETEQLVASINEKLDEERKKMEALAEATRMGVTAMNAFGSALGYIGSMAGDSTFAKITAGLGQVVSQAASTASAMMSLAGAETIEGLAEIFAEAQPMTKLALTATALAGILGMVASVKSSFAGSFAEGGTVPGSSYTGDRLIARVNSGERILTAGQWTSLSNMAAVGLLSVGDYGKMSVNSGIASDFRGGDRNVKFVIEGSQLRGVLDNYEKITKL